MQAVQHPAHTRTRDSVLMRAVRGEPVPHAPVWYMRQAGRSLPEYRALREGISMLDSCTRPDLVTEITLQPVRRYGVDAAIFFSDIVLPLKAVGVDLDIKPGVGPVIAEPVTSLEDVARIPDLVPEHVSYVSQSVATLVDELGAVPLIGFAGAPFTVASYLVEGGPSRDHVRTKAMMTGAPEVWAALMAKIAQISAAYLEVQVAAGASAVQLFDSWAGTLAPDDYVAHVQPWSAQVLEQAGRLGVPRIHFGVGTGELLALMGEAGADVVGVDWRVPLADAVPRVGGRAVQGNLDPTLVFAPTEVMLARAAQVLDAGRTAHGHVFNLGHGVLPATDPDALSRLTDFVHGYAPGSRTAEPTQMHVVVVGAGVAGAAAAFALRAARPDLDVTVLEGTAETGGKLAVAEVGGMRTDVGAEAMLQRRPEGVALARAVGLGDDVLAPATASAALWTRGTMRPIPRSLMGVPGDLAVLEGVLSTEGLAGARLDARLGPLAALAPDDDVSVGDLVADRLGEEVVQRLVEPMLGGVYAGHAHALSARAAVPGLLARLDGTRTLVEAAAAAMTPAAGAGGPVFAGIRGGVGRLPGAALAASGAELQTGAMVRGLRRTTTGWALEVGPTRSPWLVEADAVVLATPARPTSRLLEPVAPVVAADLAGIEYASMVVVTLAVRGFEAPGSGFLVPPVDGRAVKGATYSFAKWDWVGAGAPDGLRLLRCSIGRHREEQVLQRTDEEIVALAVTDLSAAVGSPLQVVDAAVRRWGGALPQYAVGHLARVSRIRAGLAGTSGLAVCGAAYDGVGIPATIASAASAVDQVLADLGRGPQPAR